MYKDENRIFTKSLKITNYQGRSGAADGIVEMATATSLKDTLNISGIRYIHICKVKAENSLTTSVRSQLIQNGFLGNSSEKNSKICHEKYVMKTNNLKTNSFERKNIFSENSPLLFVCFLVVLYLFVVVQKQLLCFYMLCANLTHTDSCLAQHEHKTNRPPYIQSSPTLLLNSQNSSEQTKTGWGPKRIGGTKGCFLHF